MVFELQFWRGTRAQDLVKPVLLAGFVAVILCTGVLAHADSTSAEKSLQEARDLYKSGQFFKSARYAFAAIEEDSSVKPEGYSWITLGLTGAGLHNAASYFFIKTLQSGDKTAIRRVLTRTQEIFAQVGPDLLRKYLIRHTNYDDYDSINKSAYLYSLAKEALLTRQFEHAIGYLNGISTHSALWPYALMLRGSAHALMGKTQYAIQDFQSCADKAGEITRGTAKESKFYAQLKREADDLGSRCIAGVARTYYQVDQFEAADQTYDLIAKASIVWPDILFEQAWNAFARQEYNRTLGRLVSYKSPALSFVYNSEADVLRAQSYLALCLYADANEVINEFNTKYTRAGEKVKDFVEGNANNLPAFYEAGRSGLASSLYSEAPLNRMMNRFIRGPYFTGLVASERAVARELEAIFQQDSRQTGVEHNSGAGFPGFLKQVLDWRSKSIRLLGGTFVKNGLLDYHATLISDFEKMAFIKLEMLKLAKDELLKRLPPKVERSRGNVEPSRKDYQYYWSFNGEFWNDELGDYVFGLESECKH